MPRKPHEPTPETRQMARSAAATGMRQDQIAVLLDISEKTLRRYYRHELDDGEADAIGAVIEALLKLVKQGNTSAAIFYSKCRGGNRKAGAASDVWPVAFSPEQSAQLRAVINSPPPRFVQSMQRYFFHCLRIEGELGDLSDEELLGAITKCQAEIAAGEEVDCEDDEF